MAIINLDLTNVEASTGGQDPVPSGWYKMAMVESELKPTSSGNGERLECVFTILEGSYANRKVYEGFNIKNPSQEAMDIAYRQLKSLGEAVGIIQIGDTVMLHNIPMEIKVKVEAAQMEQPPAGSPPGTPATEKYAAKNKIMAYRKIGSAPLAGAVVAAAPAPVMPPPIPQAAAAPAGAWTPPPVAQPWQQQNPEAPVGQPAPVPQQFAPPPGAAAPIAPPPAFAAPVAAVAQAPAAPVQQAAPAAPAAGATALPVQPPWMAQAPAAPAA
jgi:hypothetical protein